MATADRSRMRDQDTPVVVIVEHLRAGGATEIRAATSSAWIISRAPSGALVEVYWWPGHAYYVSRRAPGSATLERLGSFLAWQDAVTCALQA